MIVDFLLVFDNTGAKGKSLNRVCLLAECFCFFPDIFLKDLEYRAMALSQDNGIIALRQSPRPVFKLTI